MDGSAQGLYFILIILVNFFIYVKVYSFYEEKKKNDSLPVNHVLATIVAKRKKMTPYGARRIVYGVRTTYYATFQFEDGERIELTVFEEQYETLIEGDIGHLIFQGTKCITFNV